MLKCLALLIFALVFTLPLQSIAKDDLITVSKESEQVPLASGKSVSIRSLCPEKTVLLSGGGECLGFLNTEHKVVLTKSAPDPIGAAWNVDCTNMNREAGDVQARAWAICTEQ
ncbi:MAG: hypothetical protein KAJ31_07590 [Deltaproteobacteria bacterium]|nr:hypothetical protein [Deltaproteobacteria bacterium]